MDECLTRKFILKTIRGEPGKSPVVMRSWFSTYTSIPERADGSEYTFASVMFSSMILAPESDAYLFHSSIGSGQPLLRSSARNSRPPPVGPGASFTNQFSLPDQHIDLPVREIELIPMLLDKLDVDVESSDE